MNQLHAQSNISGGSSTTIEAKISKHPSSGIAENATSIEKKATGGGVDWTNGAKMTSANTSGDMDLEHAVEDSNGGDGGTRVRRGVDCD